jgi:riboflavin synthase
MFTGIVEELGRVVSREGSRIVVECPVAVSDATIGDSLSISGVCLTVIGSDGERASFDISDETFDRTSLGSLAPGDRVNVERPATLVSRLGGHLVQGHVDGVAETTAVRLDAEGGARVSVRLPVALVRYVVEKGSITLDGVSLTVAAVHDDEIDVALIPHTRLATTLGAIRPGDLLNVEVDVVAKYVARNIESLSSGGLAVEPGKERTA